MDLTTRAFVLPYLDHGHVITYCFVASLVTKGQLPRLQLDLLMSPFLNISFIKTVNIKLENMTQVKKRSEKKNDRV